MFPPLTDSRRPQKRSFAALVRDAVDTALAFATLGEATSKGFMEEPVRTPSPAAPPRPAATAPGTDHPHRRQVVSIQRRHRPRRAAPRAQVCVTPVHRPARRGRSETVAPSAQRLS
jgi:hypothetical protein